VELKVEAQVIERKVTHWAAAQHAEAYYVKSSKHTKEVRTMGKRNYLIEGVSGTGKTSVCQELRRRGCVAINGDRELRYQGDPTTGEKTEDVG
jgi:AAA domain-containing protein